MLLLDVSKSMAPHADRLLRFAHAAKGRLRGGCEVFSLGDSVHRLSPALAVRDPQSALVAAASVVPQWNNDTDLGHALRGFLDQHGQRGLARDAVVIVISDGCARGSAALLGEQARRLQRMARSFIWVDPDAPEQERPDHDGSGPAAGGLLAVQPFCDHLVAGHALATLGELMDLARDA